MTVTDPAPEGPATGEVDEAYRLYVNARTALATGNRPEAIRLLQLAGKLMPHFKTYELLGEALHEIGDYADAVLYLAAAAGLGSRAFRAHFLLARALLRLSPARTDDATTHLQQALFLNPNYKAARTLLDEVLKAQGNIAHGPLDES